MQQLVDKQHVHRIVEKYRPMVYRLALQNVKERYTADDITQNVFVKMIESDKVFESEEHIKAWLIRVTLNESKSYFRLASVKRDIPLPEDETLSLSNEDEYIFLFEEIKKLKPNYKNVLYLHCYEGYTVPEIAHILNKKVNTVSTWLRRAKNELEKILS